MDTSSRSVQKLRTCLAIARIANIRPRELLKLLRRMGFIQSNRDHVFFVHSWLNLRTKVSHGDREIDALLMGKIAIDDLKFNGADEFRAALRGNIPRRYLDPDAPWDGQPLD